MDLGEGASLPKVALRARKSGVYAENGEITYCRNGHALGRFGRTVMVGDFERPGDLIPGGGMTIGATDCPHCSVPVHGSLYYFKT